VTGRASDALSLQRDQPLGLRPSRPRPGLVPSPTICVHASLRRA